MKVELDGLYERIEKWEEKTPSKADLSRLYRLKQKKIKDTEEEKELALTLELSALEKQRNQLLRITNSLLSQNRDEEHEWDTHYLILQNQRLREEVLRYNVKNFLLKKAFRIKADYPQADPSQAFGVIFHTVGRIFYDHINFKNSVKSFPEETDSSKHETSNLIRNSIREISRRKHSPARISAVRVHQKVCNSFRVRHIFSGVPFEKCIEMCWGFVDAQGIVNKSGGDLECLEPEVCNLDVFLEKTLAEYFYQQTPMPLKRIKMSKMLVKNRGTPMYRCFVLLQAKNTACLTVCGLRFDYDLGRFVPQQYVACITLKDLTKTRPKVEAMFSTKSSNVQVSAKKFVSFLTAFCSKWQKQQDCLTSFSSDIKEEFKK
eukprot:snap_masked-scaffold_4-processed-gene-15.12-mRNA-1 protein AED:1.00 eAED:1.00 QI:0/-1/0/0/-1/1/1/0/374